MPMILPQNPYRETMNDEVLSGPEALPSTTLVVPGWSEVFP